MELPVSSQYRLAKHVCEIPWKWTVQPNPRWLQPSWTAWAGPTRLSPNPEVLTRHSTRGVNIHCHFEESRFGVICYSTTNTFSSATVTTKSERTWESILHSIGHTIATRHGSCHLWLSLCTVERFLFLLTLGEDWEGCAHQSHALEDAPMEDRVKQWRPENIT